MRVAESRTSDWAFCAPAYKGLEELLGQSMIFAIFIIVREPALTNSNQLLRSWCPWSIAMGKNIFRKNWYLKSPQMRHMPNSKHKSEALRGGVQPAAACQNTEPSQKEAGGALWAKKQREVRTRIKALSRAAESFFSCWRSQLEPSPRVAGAAIT